jgi:RNA polymerase sigma-70 factor, ECF subfamily
MGLTALPCVEVCSYQPPAGLVALATEPKQPELDAQNELRLAGMLADHHLLVWRTLRRLGVSPDRVDDAAQEVYITVAHKIGMIEAGAEKKYLVGTAVRMAANYRRSRTIRHEVHDEGELSRASDPVPSAERLLEQKRVRLMLDRVLDSMPNDLRTVFVLFELEDTSVPEISDLLGIPSGTVASRLRRARVAFHAAAARLRAREEGLLGVRRLVGERRAG